MCCQPPGRPPIPLHRRPLSLWDSTLLPTCSAPWPCSTLQPWLAARTHHLKTVRGLPLTLSFPWRCPRAQEPTGGLCCSTGLGSLRRLGLVYFLYLFLFSGLEYTLSFLAHQRFQFSRWVPVW
jgi:hypothetical protein